jgi:hypothetical protein
MVIALPQDEGLAEERGGRIKGGPRTIWAKEARRRTWVGRRPARWWRSRPDAVYLLRHDAWYVSLLCLALSLSALWVQLTPGLVVEFFSASTSGNPLEADKKSAGMATWMKTRLEEGGGESYSYVSAWYRLRSADRLVWPRPRRRQRFVQHANPGSRPPSLRNDFDLSPRCARSGPALLVQRSARWRRHGEFLNRPRCRLIGVLLDSTILLQPLETYGSR